MPDTKQFNAMIKELRGNIDALATLTVRNYKQDAAKDAQKMLSKMKKDLRRWSDLLDEGRLTTADFEFLVNSQGDSLKMSALERSGLALLRVDHFKKSFFNLVIDTTFDFVIGKVG